jgi:hypothetical protein
VVKVPDGSYSFTEPMEDSRVNLSKT